MKHVLAIDPTPEGIYNTFKARIDFINPKDRIVITINELNGIGNSPTVSARAAGTSCEYEVWKEEKRFAAKLGRMTAAIIVMVGAAMCTLWAFRAVGWTWDHIGILKFWSWNHIAKLKNLI